MKAVEKLLTLTLLFAGTASSAHATTVGTDQFFESFEAPALSYYPDNNGRWINFGDTPGFSGASGSRGLSFVGDSGSTWVVDTGNIDIVGPEWIAADGGQSVDMNGWERGSMYTYIELAPGRYELSFAFTRVPGGPQSVGLDVTWNGESIEGAPLYSSNDGTTSNMLWDWMSFELLVTPSAAAKGEMTTNQLRFVSLVTDGPDCNCHGAAIDAISISRVAEVPAPDSLSLMALGLPLLLLSRRRGIRR